MKTLHLLTLSVLLSSCATLVNPPDIGLTIYSTEPGRVVVNADTVTTIKNRARLRAKRQNEPVEITFMTDSLTHQFELAPKNSFMYWSNLCYFGVGMLVDRKNPRRYGFPKQVYVDPRDTTVRYRTRSQPGKGALQLHLSLPYVNSFLMKPVNEETKANTGFWGFSIGLDYHHSKSQYLNASYSVATDLFLPVPAPVDILGEYTNMSSSYFSLSNNHIRGHFTLGYGVSYARNNLVLGFNDGLGKPPEWSTRKSHHAIGLVFPAYYRVRDKFNLGVVYRPTFVRPRRSNTIDYEHLITVDLAWKITLKR